MNKLAVVLGVAAVATLAGCKDPEYAHAYAGARDEAKNIETEPAPVEAVQVEEVKTEEVKEEAPKCKCAPGTKHEKPCECGADDCQCIVEAKAVEPEYTVYIVQRGDYLAKISKKFNIKVDAIKKLNNLKSDNVRLGQKIKLPGKVEVGAQTVPEGAVAKAPAKKAYESYKGETKEYVVKSGDSLGKIAYSNGMNIRQLKELNGLKTDVVRVGQKLKIAANGKSVEKKADTKVAPVAEAKPVPAKDDAVTPVVETKPVAESTAVAPVAEAKDEVKDPAPVVEETKAPVPAEGVTSYVVQEGDKLTRIAIDFEVPIARIRELNNLGEGDEVKAGQVLQIPAAQ